MADDDEQREQPEDATADPTTPSPDAEATAELLRPDPVDERTWREDPAIPPGSRRPQRWRRGRRASDRFDLRRVVTIAIGVGAGLLLADVVGAATTRLRSLLLLVLLSLFLSFAMEPAVQFLHSRGVRRGLGTGVVFLGVVTMFGGATVAISGLVTDQVQQLVDTAPGLVEQLSRRAEDLPEPLAEYVGEYLDEQSMLLPERVEGAADSLGRQAIGLGTTLLGGIFALLTVALLTFYMVADGPRLRWQLSRRLDPARQREFLRVWELAIAKTGGYVYSRLVLAVVSAVVHIVAFTVLDLRYAAALGVWMGLVSSVIPVVGLYIAAVLPVVVSLANDSSNTLVVLAVITVYQQIENYLVQPRITAHTLSLHPAVAFLAVLLGGALLGAIGALLALPVAAIVAALVTAYAEEHEVLDHGLTTSTGPRDKPSA